MIKRAYIEIINTCNLNCGFCAKNHRRPEVMDLDTFAFVLKQVKDYTDYIYLHVQGEPLAHPEFDRILDECDRQQVHVQLVTNGTFLKNYMEIYKHPSLRKVSFSLQSVEYQDPDTLPAYLNNICEFCESASMKQNVYCELRLWRNDQMNKPATMFVVNTLKSRYSFSATNRDKSFMILPNVYVSYDNQFEWPNMNAPFNTKTGTCLGAVEQFAVLSNGNVVPCCLDCDANICFGNLRITPLKDVLESGRYRKMVDSFQKNEIREPFCQKCTFRNRFDK